MRYLKVVLVVCLLSWTVSAQKAPAFKVDPSWPQDMPNQKFAVQR